MGARGEAFGRRLHVLRTSAGLDPINSSLTEWRVADHPTWRSEIELVRFNDHAHLRGDLLPRGRRALVAQSDASGTNG